MIQVMSEDYAVYAKLELSKELQPFQNVVDEMLTRLEEFESVMKMIQSESEDFSNNTFSKILECRGEIDALSKRIDNLETFIKRVEKDLTLVEKQIEAAELQIGIPDNKLKSFLKPLFGKISKDISSSVIETRAEAVSYEVPQTFKTGEYFMENDTQPEND